MQNILLNNNLWKSYFKTDQIDSIIKEELNDFYFWNETWTELNGPYKSYLDVITALYKYGENICK